MIQPSDQIELQRLYPYIRFVVWKHCSQVRNSIPLELWDDEIDELSQIVWFKYWQCSRKETIMYPRAYIRSITHSLIIDSLRRNKPMIGLPLDEYGEINQGRIWASSIEDTLDPACEFERKERFKHSVTKIVRDIASLPVCQRNAMICLLKDEAEDIQPLADEFRKYGIDIAVLHWPNEKKQLISSKASLSIARKKMRLSKRTYMDIN